MRTIHVRRGWAAVALALGLAGAALAQKGGHDPVKLAIDKDPASVNARRARVGEAFARLRQPPSHDKTIYGNDDRIDVYEETDPAILAMADAACVVVQINELTDNGDGTYTLSTSAWNSQDGFPLCTDEPYYGQLRIGFCSGFLVGPDIVATAGHCVDENDIGTVAFLFGFDQIDATTPPATVVPADDVYFLAGIIDRIDSGDLDHAVVRLDRNVVGHNPVPIRRDGLVGNSDPLVMIGHPVVLPKKIADGAVVKDNLGSTGYFTSNLDAYGGNSGSMVFNPNTSVVEGVLVRGNSDFFFDGSCSRSIVLPDDNGTYEEVSKATTFAASVPPLGMLVTPGGDVLHYGPVGGPFTNPSVIYTLTNYLDDPLDYSVSLTANFGVLLDGTTGPLVGTIPGGNSTLITVSLGSAIDTLAAGVYIEPVAFDDLTNGLSTIRVHTVEVGQTLIDVAPTIGLDSAGPEGGPFTDTQTYTVTSQRPTPVDVRITAGDTWISLDNSPGPITMHLSGEGDSGQVIVGYSNDADTLPIGCYTSAVTFTNLDNANETTRGVSLDVGRHLYPSLDTPMAIPDNTAVTSTITAPDSFCIGDVDVAIDISHTHVGDLTIDLTSPQGTTVRLHNRTGGSDNDLLLTYDDESLPPDGPGLLADFDAEDVAGQWTLTVGDHHTNDTGTLNAWTLRVATAGDVCPPIADDTSAEIGENTVTPIVLTGTSQIGEPLEYIITSLPNDGVLWDPAGGSILAVPHTLSSDTVLYKPAIGFVGRDGFGFKVNDGQDSNTAGVALTVGQRQTILAEDFEGGIANGWTAEDLLGSSSFNWDVNTFFSDANFTNAAGLCAEGDSDAFPGEFDVALVSPAVPLPPAGELTYTTNYQNYRNEDFADVDISTDGSSWTTILSWNEDHGGFDAPPGEDITLDLSAYEGQTIRVRFHYYDPNTGDWDWYWQVDDVSITGVMSTALPADINHDGSVNSQDFVAFLNGFVASDPVADFTGNGSVNSQDFVAFLNAFVGG